MIMKNVCIASDHAGFALKKIFLDSYDEDFFVDLGTYSDSPCDYPEYAQKLAKFVLENDCMGVLICGTGIGMSIAANRYQHIRAALCCNVEMAEMARKHNDANILVLGARIISSENALSCFKKFILTEFSGEERHRRRIEQIDKGLFKRA